MSLQEAERRIAECRETQNPELDLSNLGLLRVPPAVFQLSHLQSFVLGNTKSEYSNKIQHLPDEFDMLENLVELDLSGNHLRELPYSISKLKNLSLLSLRSNEFSILPHFLCELTSLEELYISSNALNSLNESFGQLHNLTTSYRRVWF